MGTIIYVTSSRLTDPHGQASFDRQLCDAWERRLEADGWRLIVISKGSTAPPDTKSRSHVVLEHRGPNWHFHLGFQFRLAQALWRTLRVNGRQSGAVFARYGVGNVAVPIICALLRWRLVVRTGAVLPSLAAYGKGGYLTRIVAKATLALHLRVAHGVVVVTQTIREYLASEFPFARARLTVVPNGVDARRFCGLTARRRDWALPEDRPVLGFVGLLYEDQGLQTVIRAFAAIRAAGDEPPMLLIVGDGLYRQRLQELTLEYALQDDIRFTGAVPQERVPDAIGVCDAMLAPFTARVFSTTGASSLKVLEYLAADKPVLASDGPDHRFIAAHRLGALVPPDDVGAWANAIRHWMEAGSPTLNGRGSALVASQFSMDRVAADIDSLCRAGMHTRYQAGDSNG